MMRVGMAFLPVALFLSACGELGETLSWDEERAFLSFGDSVTTVMQHELLRNVAEAIREGGTDYAVAFCSTRAIPLTDSIAGLHGVSIQRLSDKNRNPYNGIRNRMDRTAWEKIKSAGTHFIEQGRSGEVHYYKPIVMATPTCTKCHGSKTDILESTLETIIRKYPDDKATGYKLDDLRGMWKVGFRKE